MTPPVLRFEEFELDLGRYELRRAGQHVALQSVPMELLILLAERRGALATRDDIVARLWGPDALMDTERSINTAIRKIRHALGDDAGQPRFVETVVGKGYRFIAVVSADTPAAIPAKRNRGWWLAAAAVLALGVLAARLVSPPHGAASMRITPFTGLPGLEATPAFSPDGTRVAYRWVQDDGSEHLYLKAVGSGPPVLLTVGPGRDSNPSWSRDGQSIAFLRRDSANQMAVYVMRATGGGERKVLDLSEPREHFPSWSGDGKALAIVDSAPGETQASIFLLSVESGRKRRLIVPAAAGTGDWAAAYSPDGRSLAFLRNGGSAQNTSVFVLPVAESGAAAGPEKSIHTGHADMVGIAWSPNGESLLCETPSGLLRIGKGGGTAEQLPFPDASQFSIAPQGGRLVYVRSIRDTDIYRIPGPGAKGTPESVISSTRMDGSPSYTPDGTRIAFVSDRTGAISIWTDDSAGGHAVQLTTSRGGTVGSPRWSPDGQWIAFDSTETGRTHIFVIDGKGGAARQITNGTSTNVRPSWSRDGRWIYFGSNRTGSWEIWKCRPDGSMAVQLTRNGGREAYEDAECRYLYYAKAPPVRGIWRLLLSGGEEEMVTGQGSQGRWALGERGLYYLKGDSALERLSLQGGERDAIPTAGLHLATGTGGLLAIGPGERTILVTVLKHVEGELMMVNGFR